MARVVALIPDLLFGSRVQGMLVAAGHDVELCSEEDRARAQAPDADVFVVDLASDAVDGATLVESMRMGRELGRTRTLAFYAHVDIDARRRAQEAGFDLAVPRSRLAREGVELVSQLASA
jgi:DNA-binding NarL/FixJ family response regulator